MSLFDRPGPRWFSIPAHRPFLADLARGLLDELAALGPEQLADATILVPSRRGARSLAEAFLEAGERRAVLLPQIRALGDLDEGEPPFEPGDLALELEPAAGGYRRRFELARLVTEHEELFDRSLDAAGALELADALGGFLDSVELEEAPAHERIEALVEGDLARHWQVSARFLRIALDAWPARLAELGLIDPAERRVRLLRALAEKWSAKPPQGVMIAAGSTGTAKANADLLKVIAALPRGTAVLPGLDLELADSAWDEVSEQHPQGAMKRLIERAEITRDDVKPWPRSERAGETAGRWRRQVVNEALRPPKSTADWIKQIGRLRDEGQAAGVDPIARGLEGLSVIAARTEEEAAQAAALLMREALETPGRTCALITPDQALARRVSARLARWGLEVDSSAGAPLAQCPAAVLAGLVSRAAADPADPVLLLAMLKHPLARMGREPDALRRARRELERRGLRGARPAQWEGYRLRLQAAGQPRNGEPASESRLAALAEAAALLEGLRVAIDLARAPLTGSTFTPAEAARGLVQALERLAEDADGSTGDLWAGPSGEAMVGLFAALMQESDGLPEATPSQFAELLDRLMQAETVRSQGAAHSRLKILGAIEARLISADRVILAGLEEGVWPQGAPIDPFLSRPMREALGLPPPERRIGLSAHDFAQAASSGEVVLLHCERREGAPSVPSRWLWRLRTLARGAGVPLPERGEVLDWSRGLDAPSAFEPAKRPRPTPPLAARPRELPVTGVETWVRDPFAVYARYVLRLRPLERPDEPIEARARGTAVHKAIERFTLAHPGELPANAPGVFQGLMVEELRAAGMGEASMAREGLLAGRIAVWLEAMERRRRSGARLLVEQQGRVTLEGSPGGAFTLTARADRLEVRAGGVDILDFKTGQPPSKKQVQSGLAPQLTLTGAILELGGFEAIGPAEPGELAYVKLSGGRKAGEEVVCAGPGESRDWSMAALEGLTRRIARFDEEATPYLSWAIPQFINERGGDYDHLARLWEWHVIGEAEGGEAAP